jgi:hypothetical protein
MDQHQPQEGGNNISQLTTTTAAAAAEEEAAPTLTAPTAEAAAIDIDENIINISGGGGISTPTAALQTPMKTSNGTGTGAAGGAHVGTASQQIASLTAAAASSGFLAF